MNDEQSQQRITGLEQTVQSLTQRVYRLEQAVTELSVDALRETPPRRARLWDGCPVPTGQMTMRSRGQRRVAAFVRASCRAAAFGAVRGKRTAAMSPSKTSTSPSFGGGTS